MKHLFIFILPFIFGACVQHSNDAIEHDIKVNNKEVQKYLAREINNGPKNPKLHYLLAQAYYEDQRYREALPVITQATALDASVPSYFYMLGKIQNKLRNPEKALAALLTTESMGKKDFHLYRLIAENYLQLHQPAKAREAVERLLLLGENAENYTLKGNVYLALQDTSAAKIAYQQAISKDNTYLPAFKALADIAMTGGDLTESAIYINQLLTIQPTNIDFMKRKANLFMQQNELDSARLAYRAILADSEDDYQIYYALAEVYYSQYRYDSAQLLAAQAFALNNRFYEAQMIVARSLDKQRKYNDAIAAYEGILASDSTFVLARTAVEDLQRKVAYLWQMDRKQQAAKDSAENIPPVPIVPEEINIY